MMPKLASSNSRARSAAAVCQRSGRHAMDSRKLHDQFEWVAGAPIRESLPGSV